MPGHYGMKKKPMGKKKPMKRGGKKPLGN